MVRTLIAIGAFLLTPIAANAQAPDITDILSLREVGGFQSGLSLSRPAPSCCVHTRYADRGGSLSIYAPDHPCGGWRGARNCRWRGRCAAHGDGAFSGAIDDRIPAWSPDGSWISYIARHGDHIELWRVRPDGRANRRLVGGERDVARFAWLSGNEIVVELYRSRSALSAQSDASANSASLPTTVSSRATISSLSESARWPIDNRHRHQRSKTPRRNRS